MDVRKTSKQRCALTGVLRTTIKTTTLHTVPFNTRGDLDDDSTRFLRIIGVKKRLRDYWVFSQSQHKNWEKGKEEETKILRQGFFL